MKSTRCENHHYFDHTGLGSDHSHSFLTSLPLWYQAGPREQELATFLMELAVLDYDLVHIPPSLIAAAAYAASLRILGSGEWVRRFTLTFSSFCLWTYTPRLNLYPAHINLTLVCLHVSNSVQSTWRSITFMVWEVYEILKVILMSTFNLVDYCLAELRLAALHGVQGGNFSSSDAGYCTHAGKSYWRIQGECEMTLRIVDCVFSGWNVFLSVAGNEEQVC